MPQEPTQAASSPADVFEGHQPSMSEYNQYRTTGELPERFKPAEPAEPAPADAPKEAEPEGEKPETEPESDPEKLQEQPKGSAAEKRIKQLLAKNKDLERQLAATAKTDVKPESSTVQPPQSYQDYRKAFKPSAWMEDFAKANPEASYEEATAAMADHLSDAREHFRTITERVQAEAKALDAKVEEARNRYEDFDEIKATFLGQVIGEKGPLVPLPVLEIINESDVLPDLIYTIGSDEQAMAEFVRMAQSHPNKAIRYIAKLENLIEQELSGRNEKGQFTKAEEKAPAKQQTSAPKPPSPVGGTSRGTFDVNDDTMPVDDWLKQRQAQIAKR